MKFLLKKKNENGSIARNIDKMLDNLSLKYALKIYIIKTKKHLNDCVHKYEYSV